MKVRVEIENSAAQSSCNRNATLSIADHASCSLWWECCPSLEGEKIGVIGEYSAENAEVSRLLLEEAFRLLKEQGCSLAIGPMNGNTWRKYRFITERGSEPSFFLEPDNPDEWPGYFKDAGFYAFAHYTSSLGTDLSKEDPRLSRIQQRLEQNGVTIRNIDMNQFRAELSRIYSVSAVSFQNAYLYTPLAEEAFFQQYLPIAGHIRPELVFLAEEGGRTVGYLFAIPDLAQASRGKQIDTVIGKTLAILPGKKYAGLGRFLIDRMNKASGSMGFKRIIHALQYEDNTRSRSLTDFYCEVFRRYTLFAKKLVV